jgi:hypothetical protein
MPYLERTGSASNARASRWLGAEGTPRASKPCPTEIVMEKSTSAETAEALNSLLRGEISAAETYVQAIRMLDGEPQADRLRNLRDDHVAACNVLRRLVNVYGEDNDTGSGAWGAFAKAVEGTAKLLGNKAAIAALKTGEEHGVKDYERAIERDDLDPEANRLLREVLLPRQRAHVPLIEQILGEDRA